MSQGYGYELFSCPNCGSNLYFPGEGCSNCDGTPQPLDEDEHSQIVGMLHKQRLLREEQERARRSQLAEAVKKEREQRFKNKPPVNFGQLLEETKKQQPKKAKKRRSFAKHLNSGRWPVNEKGQRDNGLTKPFSICSLPEARRSQRHKLEA